MLPPMTSYGRVSVSQEHGWVKSLGSLSTLAGGSPASFQTFFKCQLLNSVISALICVLLTH